MDSNTYLSMVKGEKIIVQNGDYKVPPNPIIPFIEGDGIGKDVWEATRPVLDAAVTLAYQGARQLCWKEVLAGGKALAQTGSLLPPETISAFSDYRVGLKGPLTTPIGDGFRSLNVALRHELDLYVCMRPVRWIPGVPSPVCYPEQVDMIVFRENIEDIYTGIEFEANSEANHRFQAWLRDNEPEEYAKIRFPVSSAFSIKPISREGSERLVRAAIQYAINHNRSRLSLVHKGNIMKYTEGAFAEWGYLLAESEFNDQVYTQHQYEQCKSTIDEKSADRQRSTAISQGKLIINDVITDAAFEQTLTRPEEFDLIATMNLNGDFLSDALSAQVGGLGIAPGANINAEEQLAIFEATHGTAPSLAGKNCANPCSLILSGKMMLDYLGWHEAANLVESGIQGALAAKTVTFDFHRLMPGARLLSTSEFGQAIIQQMKKTAPSN